MLSQTAEFGQKRKSRQPIKVMERLRQQLTELEDFMNKITPFLFGPLGGAITSIPYYSEGNFARVAGNILFFTAISYAAWRFRKKNQGH